MSGCPLCRGTGFREYEQPAAVAPPVAIDAPRVGLLAFLWPCECNEQLPARYALDGREYVLDRGEWYEAAEWEEEQRCRAPRRRIAELRARLFLPKPPSQNIGTHAFCVDFHRFQHEMLTIAIQAKSGDDDA